MKFRASIRVPSIINNGAGTAYCNKKHKPFLSKNEQSKIYNKCRRESLKEVGDSDIFSEIKVGQN